MYRSRWSAVLSLLMHGLFFTLISLIPPSLGEGTLDGYAFTPVELVDLSSWEGWTRQPATPARQTVSQLPTAAAPQVAQRTQTDVRPDPPRQSVQPQQANIPTPTSAPVVVRDPVTVPVASGPSVQNRPSTPERVAVSPTTAVQTTKPVPTQQPPSRPAVTASLNQPTTVEPPAVQQTPSPLAQQATSGQGSSVESFAVTTEETTPDIGSTGTTEIPTEEGGEEVGVTGTGDGNGGGALALPAFGDGRDAVIRSFLPVYPKNAQVSGARMVQLVIIVGPDGTVEDIRVALSSGDSVVDETASTIVERGWEFESKGFRYEVEVLFDWSGGPWAQAELGTWKRIDG